MNLNDANSNSEERKYKRSELLSISNLFYIFKSSYLVFLIMVLSLSNPGWGVYIFFNQDEGIEVGFKYGNNIKKHKDISSKRVSFKPNKSDISLSVKKEKGSYILNVLSLPKTENLRIEVPKKTTLILKADKKIKCKSLKLTSADNGQKTGKLINEAILVINNDLVFESGIVLKNKNKIKFVNPIVLSLEEGFLKNKSNICFMSEARIIGPTSLEDLKNPLLFSKGKDVHLINEDLIEGKGKLALFVECYISEKGRIHSPKQIIFRSKSRTRENYSKLKKLDEPVPLLKQDEDFPVIDIVRIPEELRQEKSEDSAGLGEAMAIYFYECFWRITSFSDKANSQGNGIDIIAYGEANKKQIIVHEAKNLTKNNFALKENQMTEYWVYFYLFKMYQNYVINACHFLQTNDQSWLPNEKIKKILLRLLKTNNANIVRAMGEVKPTDTKNKINEFNKKHGVAINNIVKTNLTNKKLKTFKSYFIKDISIIARGSSILHCDGPLETWFCFKVFPKYPTYFLRHDLSERFKEVGTRPGTNG
ncbi:MAG TPA: hypothetical protein VMW10_06665 [Alphaproteobacteria bacterium]|nr:hypothetical protein [Alphaproteobacteria bacterium]